MKVLSIGSDKNILNEGSEARERVVEYGKLVEELHIVIFSLKKQKIKFSFHLDKSFKQNQEAIFNFQANQKIKISKNVFIYLTNSKNRWFYIFDAYKIAKKIIHNSKLLIHNSLISCQDPFESGLTGWFVKKKFKIPFQLQVHTDFLSPFFQKGSLLNKIRVLMAKFLVYRADCIRVVSERIRNSIIFNLKVSNSKIVVLPIFVDVERIKSTPVVVNLHSKYPQFDFIILMASRLTKEKNIEMAIKVFSDIAREYPNAGLVIVGDGPEKKNQKLKAKSRKLGGNIIFEEAVSFEKLISYYKTADLFLLTSNFEGYARSVIEAMASGCPVVMTDVGLAGEVLINKKDGLVVPVGNAEKLKEAILSLISNRDLRENLIKNAKDIFNFWPLKENYLEKYLNAWTRCKF
jgi:1,2-diacylglycerol 3-alpha-glucosyltransferase